MELQAKVIQILPMQGGTSAASGKSWELKTFVCETLENYPRKVAVEIFGSERIANNPVDVDQIVTISFDLESREFNGRWYTSVRAWKIQQGAVNPASASNESAPAAPSVNTTPTAPAPNASSFDANAGEGGNLPF